MTDLSIRLQKKILTIDKQEKVDIPIVAYPPLKLRSSFYDKDPVIWVHLLENYIQLLGYLLGFYDLEAHLTEETMNDVKEFVRKYLKETALERSQILTLGTVNPQISENNKVLKNLIFQLIRKKGLRSLGITGEYVWWFVQVYVRGNSQEVRNLIHPRNPGKTPSVFNSFILFTEELLANGNLKQDKIEDLALLLGTVSKLDPKAKKSQGSQANQFFVSNFVSKKWIAILERYFGNGSSVHAPVCKTLMAISIVSCSKETLYTLVHDHLFSDLLTKTRKEFVSLYPLLYSVLKSNTVKEQFGDLLSQFSFVLPMPDPSVTLLSEMFPQLSLKEVKYVLKNYNGSAEQASLAMLEDPTILDNIPDMEEKKKSYSRSKYDDEKLVLNKKNVILGKKEKITSESLDADFEDVRDELKRKTLEQALAAMYDSDEDEPDDTYLEAEIVRSEQLLGKKSIEAEDISEVGAPVFVSNAGNTKGNTTQRNRGNKQNVSKQPKGKQAQAKQPQGKQTQAKQANSNQKDGKKDPASKEKARLQQKRNEKNKSKVANHNRKAGHDRKLAKVL